MILIHAEAAVYLERRPPSGIWGGLWSFPEVDPDQDVSSWCEEKLSLSPLDVQRWETVRHSFTHYDLDIVPVAIRLQSTTNAVEDSSDRIWYDLDSSRPVGLAAPVSGLISRLRLEQQAREQP